MIRFVNYRRVNSEVRNEARIPWQVREANNELSAAFVGRSRGARGGAAVRAIGRAVAALEGHRTVWRRAAHLLAGPPFSATNTQSPGLSIVDHWSSICRPIIGKVLTKISNVSPQIIKRTRSTKFQPRAREHRSSARAFTPQNQTEYARSFGHVCHEHYSKREAFCYNAESIRRSTRSNVYLRSKTCKNVNNPRPDWRPT